ncbi:envelope-like protein, partial [Trifolium medium]|nr:envelope-like protein [Trifolium medium]
MDKEGGLVNIPPLLDDTIYDYLKSPKKLDMKATSIEEMQCDMETDESTSNAIVLLGRKFNKILKRLDRRPRSNVKNSVMSNVEASDKFVNVVSTNDVSSPTKNIVDTVLSSLKETNLELDVVPNIDTSLAQSGQNAEIVPGTTDEESEYESASEQEKSQDKVVTEEEEGKSDDSDDSDVNSQADESDKTMSADEEESISVDKTVSADKNVPDETVVVDDCDSIDQPLQKSFGGSIAKRLRNRKGNVVPSASVPAKTTKKTTGVGPKKGWSKVVAPAEKKKKTLKMKEVPTSDSDCDVEPDVPDIVPSTRKKIAGKKVPLNVSAAPMNNVSFHSEASVSRWKFVYNRRLALER